MKRRKTDPLAPLLPVARLAAVGLVAAAATLASVHVGAVGSATTLDRTGAASSKNAQVAAAEASTLLGEAKVPPGSVRLPSQPADAPNHGQSAVRPDASTLVTRTTWWSTALSPAAALRWLRENPPNGLVASTFGPSLIGFQGDSSGVINEADVYAETFTLPDGATGIQLSSVVVYLPDRPAQETIPTAARKLVAIPESPNSGPGEPGGVSATITDQAEIDRVAAIINALPTWPPGVYNCPEDNGGDLDLDFESGGGAVLAQVEMKTSGCEGTSVTVDGKQQPMLSGSAQTAQQIQGILGTHWQLTLRLP